MSKNTGNWEDDTKKIILFPKEEAHNPQKTTGETEPSLSAVEPPTQSANPQPPKEPKPPLVFTAPIPDLSEKTTKLHATKSLPPIITIDGDTHQKQEDKIPEKIKEIGREIANKAEELSQRADEYADAMFEEDETTDHDEIRRIERLVPGTDHEKSQRRYVPPRAVKKPPPLDVTPRALALQYTKGLKGLMVRKRLEFLLGIITCVLTLSPVEETFVVLQQENIKLLVIFVLFILGVLLSVDILADAVIRCYDKKLGLDTLCVLSVLVTIADCAFLLQNPSDRLPYCAIVLFQLGYLLFGTEQKRRAHRICCKVAEKAKEPYLLRSEPFKWNGNSAFTKTSNPPKGFGSQMQEEDGAQKIYAISTPILLTISVIFLLFVSKTVEDFVWGSSAVLCALIPFGGQFAYGRSAFKVASRLTKSQSAIAGWPNTNKSARDQVIVTDTDLFPIGSVTIAATRIMQDFRDRTIASYTATMLTQGGLGIARVFEDFMVSKGGKFVPLTEFQAHEAGGLSAKINHEVVLVGCAAFMELMKVIIPAGYYMDQLVFVSVNGKLAGVFSLEHTPNLDIFESMDALVDEKILPILATRDFSLTPEVLKNKFRLKTSKMDFPSVKRRYELSSNSSGEGSTLVAVLCREGLQPFADCIIATHRLRKHTHLAVAFSLISSVLGLFLVGYLVSQQTYSALALDNLLLYLALWLLPVWVVTDLPQRF